MGLLKHYREGGCSPSSQPQQHQEGGSPSPSSQAQAARSASSGSGSPRSASTTSSGSDPDQAYLSSRSARHVFLDNIEEIRIDTMHKLESLLNKAKALHLEALQATTARAEQEAV